MCIENIQAKDLCQNNEKFIEAQPSTTPDKLLDEKMQTSSLIVIGESHAHFSGQDAYPTLIQNLKNNNKELDCLFIEGWSSRQWAIDKFFKNEASYEDTIGYVNKTSPNGKHALAAAPKRLIETAKVNNIKVIAVDENDDNMTSRNSRMAANIFSAMQSTCKKAIFIVGKQHISPSGTVDFPKWPMSIPQLLKKQGVSVSSINLFGSKDRSLVCADRKPVNRTFGFKTDGRGPLISESIFEGVPPEKWSDYDGAL